MPLYWVWGISVFFKSFFVWICRFGIFCPQQEVGIPPLPFLSLGCQAAFCFAARSVRRPISRALAVWMPKISRGFRSSRFWPLFFQVVMLFFFTKAPFEPRGSILGDQCPQLVLLFPMPGRLSLGFEVCFYIIGSGKHTVLVGCIKGIGPDHFGLGLGKPLCFVDGAFKAGALIKGFEADVFVSCWNKSILCQLILGLHSSRVSRKF